MILFIYCNNTDEGGIEGCEKCFSNEGNIKCQQCKEGFILNEKEQICLKISEDKSLQSFINCQRVSLNSNNIYYCTKCYEGYNLLKENDKSICVNNEFIVTPKGNLTNYCKESINYGTEDKPKHSCNKCIENDFFSQNQREKGEVFTRIIFSENKYSTISL